MKIIVYILSAAALISVLAFIFAGCKRKKQIMDGPDMIKDTNDITKTEISKPPEVVSSAVLVIDTGKKKFYASLEKNSSANALIEKLNSGPITVRMSDYGNFEKVGELPWELPTNDASINTSPGDIILYQGNKITVYYDKNTWTFTKLASIGGVSREELLEAFGDGDVELTFSLEWSE